MSDLTQIRGDYLRFARKTIALLLVMAAGLLGTGGISIYLVAQNSQRADDIQQSRFDASFAACELTNERHDNTIDKLDEELDKIKKHASPAAIKQIEQSRDFTVLLINALVPKTANCRARAEAIVDVNRRK